MQFTLVVHQHNAMGHQAQLVLLGKSWTIGTGAITRISTLYTQDYSLQWTGAKRLQSLYTFLESVKLKSIWENQSRENHMHRGKYRSMCGIKTLMADKCLLFFGGFLHFVASLNALNQGIQHQSSRPGVQQHLDVSLVQHTWIKWLD